MSNEVKSPSLEDLFLEFKELKEFLSSFSFIDRYALFTNPVIPSTEGYRLTIPPVNGIVVSTSQLAEGIYSVGCFEAGFSSVLISVSTAGGRSGQQNLFVPAGGSIPVYVKDNHIISAEGLGIANTVYISKLRNFHE